MSENILNFKLQKKYTLIVGFNDMQSRTEELSRDAVLKIVMEYFGKIKFPFSVSSDVGGYNGCNGYCSENNIVFTFINADEVTVTKIASAVKMLLNQQAVLLYENEVEVAYI